MRKTIIIAFFLSISLLNAKQIEYKLFPDRSGQFVYQISGAMTGTQKIYFDDYGQKYLLENDTKYFGNPNKGRTYIEADTSYSIEDLRNSSYKYYYPLHDELIKQYQESKNPITAIKNYFLKENGILIGQEEISGYNCDVWEVKSHREKIWLWKSYKIKIESGYEKEKIIYEITKLNTDIEFKNGKFKKPNIPFPDLMKKLKTK